MCNNFTGPSGTHRPRSSLPTRRVIYSSDENDEPERPVWPSRSPRLESEEEFAEPPQRPQKRRKTRRRANPFIESEAGVEGDASDDESDEDNDLADFIVSDDVEY